MSVSSSELTRSFETGELDPAAFKHTDHVAVAYSMLERYEFLEACSKFAASLRVLTQKAGVPEKFNATITVAFLSLIAERMAAGKYRTYKEFIEQNTDLRSMQVLNRWYSPERLSCNAAREMFLLPDAV